MNLTRSILAGGLVVVGILATGTALSGGGPATPASGAAPPSIKVINCRNDGSGVYPDAEPPVDLNWSAPSSVLWKTPIPGSACASDPIIVGDRIFVQSEPLRLLCLEKNTGKVLWEREKHARPGVFEEDKSFRLERFYLWWATEIDPKNEFHGVCGGFGPDNVRRGYERLIDKGQKTEADLAAIEQRLANPPETWPGCNTVDVLGWSCCVTPASDGRRVVAAFRTGEVVCYDLDGNRQWISQILDKDGSVPKGNIKGHTPLLAGDAVVLYWTNPARFVCLDIATGKERWQTDLAGRGGIRSAAATCRGGAWYACSLCGNMVRVSDGKIVLTVPIKIADNQMSVSHADGLFDLGACGVMAPDTPEADGTVAWNHDYRWLQQVVEEGRKPLDWEECAPILKGKRGDADGFGAGGVRYFAASVTKDGIIYTYSSSLMAFAARDVKTGKFFYMKNLTDDPEAHWLSCAYADLCLAGDYIFVNNGAFVLKTGREFALVKKMRVGGNWGCNLVFDGRRVYWRDPKNLVCVGSRNMSETPANVKTP